MEAFVLRAGGEEYRLAMPAAQVLAAEKQLGGMSLPEAMDKVDRVAVQQALLWASLQKHNHGMTMDRVCGLMDAMRGGCEIDGVAYPDFSMETRVRLCARILIAAGFFTGDAAAELGSRLAAQP